MKALIQVAFSAVVCAQMIAGVANAHEFSGNLSAEWRYFAKEAPSEATEQEQHYLALGFEPEWYTDFGSDNHSFTLAPYFRAGVTDEDRSHSDLRQAVYTYVADDWELWAGIHQVFWGVTESGHLVDIINQTDGLEGVDGEDKLGQPMVLLSMPKDWGTLDFYLLPQFREREFNSDKSRLNIGFTNGLQVIYESEDEDKNIDWAVRYQGSIGDGELGLSHFSGTARMPSFALDEDFTPYLYYAQTQRTGIDTQWIFDDWLWKLEVLNENLTQFNAKDISHTAAIGGFEKTFYGVFGSIADIGLLIEHHYDDLDAVYNPQFAKDTFIGSRLAMNDIQSTDLLAGIFLDHDSKSVSFFAEASRRIGENYKLSLDAFIIGNATEDALLKVLEDQDNISLNFFWYF